MIEKAFDASFVAQLALREKQIQQNYRPIIAVHKWFARRPGTLFRALLLSEFVPGPLREAFYEPQRLDGVRIADPFMGGGTPLVEANRVGCDVLGFDINPMSYWIVHQELGNLDVDQYRRAAERLRGDLERRVGHLYRTRCANCGNREACVKYFLWVKALPCGACGESIDLFPGYVLALNRRHPRFVIVCSGCSQVCEIADLERPGACTRCDLPLRVEGTARRGKAQCRRCEQTLRFPQAQAGPPEHRLFAIEYHCPTCKPTWQGRFFKSPDDDDLRRLDDAAASRRKLRTGYVPSDEIPAGDETARLHRWGYRRYRELFNDRQLLGLELSCRLVAKVRDAPLRHALATNLSDLLRYQNMLCRYDAAALKSLDVFSVHGFPVGLIQCESNLLGIPSQRLPAGVGSGGWWNIIEKYAKAKDYCARPFEVLHRGKNRTRVSIQGEWIGDRRTAGQEESQRVVDLRCGDSSTAQIAPQSLDAVLTDPPYFGNVQYAELMDFCYVWLRRLLGKEVSQFAADSTRCGNELTGNRQLGRDLAHFTDGLAGVFCRMAEALKPGGPLAFTFHHNRAAAYASVAVALLRSGLPCTAVLSCPAEMGGSIHINGTSSSVVDSIFVCRKPGLRPSRSQSTASNVQDAVEKDVMHLANAGLKASAGDIHCIALGHATGAALRHFRAHWPIAGSTHQQVQRIEKWIAEQIAGLLGPGSGGKRGCLDHPAQCNLTGSPVTYSLHS